MKLFQNLFGVNTGADPELDDGARPDQVSHFQKVPDRPARGRPDRTDLTGVRDHGPQKQSPPAQVLLQVFSSSAHRNNPLFFFDAGRTRSRSTRLTRVSNSTPSASPIQERLTRVPVCASSLLTMLWRIESTRYATRRDIKDFRAHRRYRRGGGWSARRACSVGSFRARNGMTSPSRKRPGKRGVFVSRCSSVATSEPSPGGSRLWRGGNPLA